MQVKILNLMNRRVMCLCFVGPWTSALGSSSASVLEKTITCCESVVLYANPLKNRGVPTMVLSMFGIFVFKIEGSRDMANANTAKFLIATLICTSQTNRYPLSRSHK